MKLAAATLTATTLTAAGALAALITAGPAAAAPPAPQPPYDQVVDVLPGVQYIYYYDGSAALVSGAGSVSLQGGAYQVYDGAGQRKF